MLAVSVFMIISSMCYIRMHPKMKLVSTELLLVPFRLNKKPIEARLHFSFSLRISESKGRHPRYSSPLGRSSNGVYLVWAVFGGFISHFILSNYLTVLLKPDYETPVDTTADLFARDMTPFYKPGAQFYIQYFADSPDPVYQELSRRLVIPEDWDEYYELLDRV